MDTQPTPPNAFTPDRQPAGTRPENLQPGNLERPAPAVDAAPSASAAPPPQASSAATAAPKLTADDVAAAIAAVPGPTPPPVAGMPVPNTAADVDVIEPEWVDKAEEVVAQHQGDPYGEEEAIEDLQQDYLQKRYGYTVADANADGSGTTPPSSGDSAGAGARKPGSV